MPTHILIVRFPSPPFPLSPFPPTNDPTQTAPRRRHLHFLLLLLPLLPPPPSKHPNSRSGADHLPSGRSLRSLACRRARHVFWVGGHDDVAVFGVWGALGGEGGWEGWEGVGEGG